MILIALAVVVVLAETVIGTVVGHHDIGARPVHPDLDTEVVMRLCGQLAAPGTTLAEALRQGDGGWNLMLTHLLDGQVFVFLNILPLYRLSALRK